MVVKVGDVDGAVGGDGHPGRPVELGGGAGAVSKPGTAVSGEITLHGDHLYVQVSQSALGSHSGILFRTCKGRKDYVGGPNNFASLDLLNRPGELAHWIREVCDV